MNDNVTDINRERYNRIDEKLDRILFSIESLGQRQTSLETRMTALERTVNHGFGQLNERVDLVQQQLDKIGQRLARIEKHADLAQPAT